jgi:hypothetical protein
LTFTTSAVEDGGNGKVSSETTARNLEDVGRIARGIGGVRARSIDD